VNVGLHFRQHAAQSKAVERRWRRATELRRIRSAMLAGPPAIRHGSTLAARSVFSP